MLTRLAAIAFLLALAGASGGCTYLDRLKNVGEQPKLSSIENPAEKPGYRPVQMPMPAPQPVTYYPNSLWRNGSVAERAGCSDLDPSEFRRYGSARQLYNFRIDNAGAY